MIGTVGTISSGAYVQAVERAARQTDVGIELSSAACPGFVEFVERGQLSGDEVMVLAERLLAPLTEAKVDTLLLGAPTTRSLRGRLVKSWAQMWCLCRQRMKLPSR